jgi:hypothetical protein
MEREFEVRRCLLFLNPILCSPIVPPTRPQSSCQVSVEVAAMRASLASDGHDVGAGEQQGDGVDGKAGE